MDARLHKMIWLWLTVLSTAIGAQESLVDSGASWRYYDQGLLPNNWYLDVDKFANWNQGVTPIGYGDKKVTTSISFGDDPDNKHPAKYFVKEFNLDSNSFLAYGLQVKRDDGIVVYINGKEVFRDNLPLVVITGNTYAVNRIDGSKESEILFAALDADALKVGSNTIAVSVHQSNPSSSDCIFDFELFGYTDPKMLSNVITNQADKNNKLENQIKVLNNSLLIEKVSLQLEIEQNRVENFRLVIAILGFLIFILLVAFVVVLNNLRITRKKNEQETKRLEASVREKSQELMLLNTKLLFDKQYLKEIRADLKGLKTSSDATVKNILYDINRALDNEEEWKTLERHFNELYSGFYDRLLAQHTSLTEVELRHCMLIKLHLQTKEIAKLFHIDPRSVQTARYRIKKKMNLAEETDLRNYLLWI